MNDTKAELKMWLVVRCDLSLDKHPGKLAGQAGHAFMLSFIDAEKSVPTRAIAYIKNSMPKIVVKCPESEDSVFNDDELSLLQLRDECIDMGLPVGFVRDEGRTVLKNGTATCFAVGPCLKSELPESIQTARLL